MVQEPTPSGLSTSRGIPAQLFAALISSSDDAIIVKSLDGVIWTWNQGAMSMYGYTPDEAVGQPMTMLSPPDRVGEIADILFKIRKGERVSHYETIRQRKDGTTYPRVDIGVSHQRRVREHDRRGLHRPGHDPGEPGPQSGGTRHAE